ncbi:MAG: glycosyltransferase family 2 protein [Verrucomicrobium sp.]|nr:glycosyltransferase family A protein [Verrucomicrobium sp.]
MPARVAVVIPCYNHGQFVGEALESVLAQTRKADRILVIDDGSKDNSVEVLRSFESRGVEVWARENQGAHNTINELVNRAAVDCEFVSILNSDDRYLPQRLELCLDLATQHPVKCVFSTGLRVIDGEGKIMPEDAPRSRWFHGAWSLGQQEGITMPEWLGQANFVATTTNVFARASYLQQYPFRPYRFNHDYFFLATAALENQIAVRPEVMLEYRIHGNNTISTKPEPLIKEMVRMHLDLYQEHAESLIHDPGMRKRFYQFTRSSWDNISSFHAGLLQLALARLTTLATEEELEAIAASLEGPELEEFPNRLLAGAYDGKTALVSGGVLNERLDTLRAEHDQIKKDREALDLLARGRQKLLSSKWLRLGLALGQLGALTGNEGKKPADKWQQFKTACESSKWVKFGATLRSKGARELLASKVEEPPVV